MSVAEPPRVLRGCPGRVRINLPDWGGLDQAALETALRRIPGVQSAQANSTTHNVLIAYDERRLDPDSLLARVAGVASAAPISVTDALEAGGPGEAPGAAPGRDPRDDQTERPVSVQEVAELLGSGRVIRERGGILSRARVAVRGLERDGDLARRIVDRLRKSPGVARVSVSRLTGRVLIEFDEHQTDVEDLISLVARMELPDLPGEDCPAHPLDPEPLIQSAARTVGSALGLSLLAARRVAGKQGPPSSSSGPVAVAAGIGILDGLPPLRSGMRHLLGRDRAQLVFGAVHVVSLTFSGSPLGLAVTGAGALRLLTEVRARRARWRAYEERLSGSSEALPGETVGISAGERCPLAGVVIEGSGTMIGRDGLPNPLCPGASIPGGARVFGGPFVVELHADRPFGLEPRPVPEPKTRLDHYLALLSPVSVGYAAVVGVLTRSPTRMLSSLLLVNARAALIGAEAADSAASTRVLRSGVTIVGSRYGRSVREPGVLLIDGTRVLTDRRLQVGKVLSLRADLDESEILSIASGIAAASGSPWGPAFPLSGRAPAQGGQFEIDAATAQVGHSRMRLGAAQSVRGIPGAAQLRDRGHLLLVLTREGDALPLGMVALRPRLADGALRLLDACARRGVAVELLAETEPAVAQLVGDRTDLTIVRADAVRRVRECQCAGKLVAVLSDSPQAAPALAAADMAIALTSGLSGRFAARADLLAPDLDAVSAILQAGARRRAAVDDAIALSALSNGIGAILGLRSAVGLERGSQTTYVAALAAIALASVRLAGGGASALATRRLVDPEPEQWGVPPLPDLLRHLDTSEQGLSAAQAQRRAVSRPQTPRENPVVAAAGVQLRSPLNGALAAGAGISLMFGAVADVALIGAVILANTAIGVWQEHQASRASELLAREASGSVSVWRSGELVEVLAHELVVGDVFVIGSGDRVPADARLLESDSLEVDEASLTGESLPVVKDAADPTEAGRVILEGSDVTVGSATAVVFAVGEQTRIGATTAALSKIQPASGTLDRRLNRLVRQSVPVIAGGAGLIAISGVAWRRPLASQLALAAGIATAVVPEGLPLLAGVAEAAVAQRLAGRNALVRRLSAVEALGRVDIACTDKTGTLTAGRLELTAVETFYGQDGRIANAAQKRELLLAAALASPHPEAQDAGSHPTDLAVIAGAEREGLSREIRAQRDVEVPFEPARSFHATLVDGRLMVKGAAEALVERCSTVRRNGRPTRLDQGGRQALLDQAEQLARRGLRVLMVAEGDSGSGEDPRGLVALGLVGISDPLREGVAAAVARCEQAGVRVIMLTGDHPATAQAIAEQAGLDVSGRGVLSGAEISSLEDPELDRRLGEASVVARITPLDKLRIVERLQSQGHTVAMTGDGVNDAPALRLADVGVAMGLHGTEVARQASDVVLADDDFATLVETLVEGRSFWRNIRRSLGLLMGGNLGELGLIVGASVLGLAAPLSTRQILAVNLITDVLPALAVAAQQPEHRDLATLRREGGRDQDQLLRADVLRRGSATAGPALAAYAIATRLGTPAQARSVAFGGIVATQLAQTVSLGRSQDSLARPVVGAIAGSGGFALAAMTLPALSGFFGLALPTIPGFALIGLATIASLAVSSPREEAPLLSLPAGPSAGLALP